MKLFFVKNNEITGNNDNRLFGFVSVFDAGSFCTSRSLSAGFVTKTSGAAVDTEDFLED